MQFRILIKLPTTNAWKLYDFTALDSFLKPYNISCVNVFFTLKKVITPPPLSQSVVKGAAISPSTGE